MAAIVWKAKTDIEQEKYNQAYEDKKAEIKKCANDCIFRGFNYTINGVEYHFSNTVEDQLNFITNKGFLDAGALTEVEHTATNLATGERVRIMINKPIMDAIVTTQFAHREAQIQIYDDRLTALDQAQTVDEINAIIVD